LVIDPSGSELAAPEKAIADPTVVVDGVAVKLATGGWFAGATATVRVVVAVAPLLSVTFSVMVNVPVVE
jgi:hypothetical protein